MKNDNCKQIEELLVEFADDTLSEQDSLLIQEHLNSCQDCAQTVKALKESLIAAQMIWQDNLAEPVTKRRPVRRYIQIAAGILFVVGLFFAGHTTPKDTTTLSDIAQAGSLPTLHEIELKIEWEGIAAMLFAKAELIKQNPDRVANSTEYVQNEYRHIVEMYPDTMTAKNVAKLID